MTNEMNTVIGIAIPFLGTSLGAACVFFMKRALGDLVQRALAGFAAGVMNEYLKVVMKPALILRSVKIFT